ncbi:uncharacterized protein At4g26485 isoform X1 [Ziziphus jujuba]|uniref:Uncharacterized protein At4g26485 isoform X1 n=2 Tax=Ziziphus jujuba TaxID=326968 RepID=A0ABM3IF78_ZIZJJ|nr:uncharacterized protein At4g26485 isoform X1 [Ziziphus jujuba]
MDNSMEEKWIKHYSSRQKILLVGEGDFSFSACLATAFGSATNMVATSLDSKDALFKKYRSKRSYQKHLKELENRGCLVLHEVDAKNMNQHPILKSMKFDIIIYNFPHAGHFRVSEGNKFVILLHKKLLKAFFENAREMLNEGGEVHVAHRDDHPYKKWKLEEVGSEAGLCLKEKVVFSKSDYPGYNNVRGGLIRSSQTFPLKECFTFKFCLGHKIQISIS